MKKHFIVLTTLLSLALVGCGGSKDANATVEPSVSMETSTEPTAESIAEATTEPTAESIAEATTEPTAESIAEATKESTAESTVEPTEQDTVTSGEITGHEAAVKIEDIDISEANDTDTQVADGVENEDNVEPTTEEPATEETPVEFVVDGDARQFLLDLGATEAQINALKSTDDFMDLYNLLVHGRTGGSGSGSGNTGGSSGGSGDSDEDYHDPSMEGTLGNDAPAGHM